MAGAPKRSAKRSATRRGGPPERLTFFVDECLGRKALPEALRAAEHDVVLHSDQFASGVEDAEWLALLRVHRNDWVVLTKDKQIRKRPLEKLSIMASGLRVFALTAGDLTTDAQVDAFMRGLRRIVRISKMSGPYIARVTGSGDVKVVERPKPGHRKGRLRRKSKVSP